MTETTSPGEPAARKIRRSYAVEAQLARLPFCPVCQAQQSDPCRTSGDRTRAPHAKRLQKQNHLWEKSASGFVFCRCCLRVRQADGSSDKKPCKRVGLSLRRESEKAKSD